VAAVTSPSTTIAVARLFGVKSENRRPNVPLAQTRNILVLRPDGIGDVIMTGPMLRELRRAAPQADVTLVVSPRALDVVERCPYVDQVFTVKIPPPKTSVETWWRPLSRRLAAISVARRHFRGKRYDLALVPRWGVDHHEASVLGYLSGASVRVGYSEHVSSERANRNRGYDRFFTLSVRDQSVKHEVERNLAVLSALRVKPSHGALEAWLSSEDVEFADRTLASVGATSLVAIAPGAGSLKRMWPIGRFVEVGRWVTDRGGALVLVGGAGEEALGEDFVTNLDGVVFDLINRATLRETIAVLQRCSMFCGNDAGPMHLAAAAGIPVLEVSCHPRGGDDLHANAPSRFAPWGVPYRVVQPAQPRDRCTEGCRASTPHCILNVPVASVIQAMDSLLREEPVEWFNSPSAPDSVDFDT
jgi:ADP-heptose:LPS heptosyltransferase